MADETKRPDPEQRIVFSVAKAADGTPIILIGIPAAAWDYMKDGKTHGVDFTRLGIPLRLLIYGGPDHASCKAVIDAHNAAAGRTSVDLRREDFSPPGMTPAGGATPPGKGRLDPGNDDPEPLHVLRAARCGCCGKDPACPPGTDLGLAQLMKRAKWRFPVSGNVLTGQPCVLAVAVLCPACQAMPDPVRHVAEAVELRGSEIVYHRLETLEAAHG